MNCQQARELFSGETDGDLGAAESAGLHAHVEGCPECRRELTRFRATVAALRSVEPVRAPVGFVDRVLEVARPPTWTERLRRRLASPAALRRPIAVMVSLLVAVTALYLYERTPELQRGFEIAPAGRPTSTPAPAPRQETAPLPSAPAPAPAPAAPAEERDAAPRLETPRRDAAAPATAPESGEKKAATDSAELRREAPARVAEERQRLAATQASPPEGGRAEQAATTTPPPPAAAPPRAALDTAKSARALASRTAAADVEGRLRVADRGATREALVELAARLGGTASPASGDAGGDVVHLRVPAPRYPELLAALGRLGRWQPLREPAELPDPIRIVLLLTD